MIQSEKSIIGCTCSDTQGAYHTRSVPCLSESQLWYFRLTEYGGAILELASRVCEAVMAADRLSALQERIGELLRSKDAHVAFAFGGVLGCASAALAAVWLHRRNRTRPAVVQGLALQRARGLSAVLDLSASWNDQHLAVCALRSQKLQLTSLPALVDVDMHHLA